MTSTTSTNVDSHSKTFELLASRFGPDFFRTVTFRDNVRLYVSPEQLVELLSVLKNVCGFGFLSEVGGTDYLKYPGERVGGRFEVHYVLRNLETSEWLVVKTSIDDPEPSLPSVVPLWNGANWMEREVFDMFGIHFKGHPDLRRILMPEEFTSYPLRKDYPLRGRGERHNFPKILRADS